MATPIPRKRVLAALILLIAIGTSALLHAACPPFTKPQEMSVMEQLARHAPKDRPLSDEELVKLLKSGDIKSPPLLVSPPSGPAPLTVTVGWFLLSDDSPAQIEIDLEGNETFKPIGVGFDPHSGIQNGKLRHIYEREGTFQVTLRVRDNAGGVTTHAKQVVAMSKAAFETSLQRVWADYKSSLGSGDITSALECMHSSVRDAYQKLLPEVLKSGTPINQILSDIRFERLLGSSAEFEMVIQEPSSEVSYLVTFDLDVDGVWRLRFM
jgi:hypothetical protein